MIGVERRQLGRHMYVVQQLGAKQGGRALVRLAKMLGKAAGGAAGDLSRSGGLTIESLARLVGDLASSVDEADYDFLVDMFAPQTRVTGGEYGAKEVPLSSIFDVHFAGAYGELAQWLVFALEANYQDFFGAVRSAIGPASGANGVSESQPESPSTLQVSG